MNSLTETQHTMLALIAERIAVDGMPPSQAEIARAMGFSGVRAAQYHLEALEQAGAILRVPGKARGIRLLQPDVEAEQADVAPQPTLDDALRLPVLGRVAAGAPIGADAGVDDYVLLKIGKDRIRLLPRNPDYQPIEVLPDQEFAIEGLYCGLVRRGR